MRKRKRENNMIYACIRASLTPSYSGPLQIFELIKVVELFPSDVLVLTELVTSDALVLSF